MTQNQLKYWELRWKQHYERLYLAETRRSNLAKETETQRHNLATERISKAELVLKRIELSQSQEKINQEWQKIGDNEVSILLNYAINAEKNRISKGQLKLDQEKHKLNKEKWDMEKQEIQAKIDKIEAETQKIFSDIKIGVADMVATINQNMNKDTVGYIEAYAKAFGKGWLEGGASSLAAELKSIKGLENYQKIVDSLVSGLNETVPGLNLDPEDFQIDVTSDMPLANNTSNNKGDKINKLEKDTDKLAMEVYGPDATQRLKYGSQSKNARDRQIEEDKESSIRSQAKPVPDGVTYSGPSNVIGTPKTGPAGIIYSGGKSNERI